MNEIFVALLTMCGSFGLLGWIVHHIMQTIPSKHKIGNSKLRWQMVEYVLKTPLFWGSIIVATSITLIAIHLSSPIVHRDCVVGDGYDWCSANYRLYDLSSSFLWLMVFSNVFSIFFLLQIMRNDSRHKQKRDEVE